MIKFDKKVTLPDTDAAGILFFGNYLKLAHDAYEAFMDSIGFSLSWVLNEASYLLLIAHSEADYRASLRLGEEFSILLSVEKIGRTSFTIKYEFVNGEGGALATARTVHVIVDKKNGSKAEIPGNLKDQLAQHL